MMGVWDLAAAICLLLGAFFSFSAGVGVLRFDNLFSRMHVVAKPQVLGLLLLLTALGLRLQDRTSVALLVLVAVFQLMTSPVAAHMVGRAGVRTGHTAPSSVRTADDPSPETDAER
ncbi:monovalent cation/H(+) antiporter subunit G [Myceligenerans xiligouense]|uniref:Multisubunit sodium/proton antiporter MrpG subunit n=1 Tax=Myceligenerans xiligouense TaxID=253184 RepID=A0A3N4YXP2_9MICO|nr:monovalent cation/H(+) antiporter subunit G [Myceligenerans xiligouense]RPF23410.1 multisubunit sodium/proton antiporter MrpG subunit [Myceligenerans xiligouense]